jgi:tetratricopeptide (TPR) repeat protein/tRNA A-37 threonylcarbamoyl transferase component Bud32
MGCPDANTITSFIEGRLKETERSRVAGHLDSCPACFELVAAALAQQSIGQEVSTRSERPHLPRGAAIGRYMVVELVGRGGMGEVYAAYDPKLNRRIALKLLDERATSPRSVVRFSREAQSIARLSHPNVVAIYDTGTVDDRVFLAMEYVDGQTLAAWLAARPRTWREILDVFSAAGHGLAAAHAAGLVHRDFKPQNVMVGRDGVVRVMDFGLARAIDQDPDAGENASAAVPDLGSTEAAPVPLTRTGELIGTPLYMAPEQFRARRTDARTDQFSFCVALYEALHGTHPFPTAALGELMAAVTEGRVQAPATKSAVPPWLRRILLRGLASDPAGRWPSMDALIAALSHDPARARNRWLLGLAATTLVACGLWTFRAPRRAESLCRGGPARLAEAWELPGGDASAHPRRDATRAAFVKTGQPEAAETWDRTSRIVDQYADGWLRMYGDACEATHVRGEQSTQVLDLRMNCLADRLNHVKALADVFGEANPDVVDNAVSAAGTLPPLDRCADVEALRSVVPPPDDPNVRARVEVLKRDLAHVQALGESGQCTAAAAAGRELVAHAEETGYLPLLAESLNAPSSRGGGECMRPEDQVRLSERAAMLGLASHDEEAAAEGAIITAHTRSDRMSQVERARIWIDLADAILRGMSHPPWTLDSWRLLALAPIRQKEGDLDGALEACQRARELIEKYQGTESLDYAKVINNIGAIYSDQQRFAEALPYLQRSAQITLKMFGPDHAHLGLVYFNEAEALNRLGRYEEARAAAQLALEVWRRDGSGAFFRAAATTMLGEALMGLGRAPDATSQLEKAVALFGDERSIYPCEARFGLARALWSRAETRPRALSLAREARDDYQRLAEGKQGSAEVATWLATRNRRPDRWTRE